MNLKAYQQETVDEFGRWYDLLRKEQTRASQARVDREKMRESGISKETIKDLKIEPDLADVWKKFAGDDIEWKERTAPDGRMIPHVCIKVPTGGGKTRIASAIIKSINKKSGLVLWMVPSKAIMEQTVNILKDKENPIRRMLDTVSHNTVEIVKKDERLSMDGIRENLCIMPLMQQGTAGVDRDFLKIKRDNGIYSEFFPDMDDKHGIGKLLKEHPGLDMRDGAGIPRKSLVNVFRMVKPIIILDEAHKVSATNFGRWAEYVNRLGPSMVIELTATPNEEQSNILKTVTGEELRKESMIKKSIRVNPTELNWQGLLRQAVRRLKELSSEAATHHRYIRPIMIVRVELTEPKLYEQRGSRIHAMDAKKYLIDTMGIPSEHVAIKSSSADEIRGHDLMKRDSPIRYIITKNALMEGWDCPFAYMLVILDGLKSTRALTQLLGRILRQPYTEYTESEHLNDCYVYCIHDGIANIIELIRRQLDNEGLTGIGRHVGPIGDSPKRRTNRRRVGFEKLRICLPTVLHKYRQRWTEIDYDRHIIHDIDWDGIRIGDSMDTDNVKRNMEAVIDTITGRPVFVSETVVDGEPNLFEWVSILSGIVPNSWQAARIIREFWDKTKLRPNVIYANESALQNVLLTHLREQIITKSESVFRSKIKDRIIRFDMHTSTARFKMRGEYEMLPDDGELLQRREPRPVQLSLDEPVYKEDFDTDGERKFAGYLDEADAIEWWHRVAAKDSGEYYLRGWQKNRIYPDFIALFSKENKRILRIYEIKGRHLDNPDTEYKQKVLGLLEETLNAGKLSVTGGTLEGDFKLVFEDKIDDPLNTGLRRGQRAEARDLKPVKTNP